MRVKSSGVCPGVNKCPASGQHKICKCPTPGTDKAGKCPAVARGGGWEGCWAQLELTDALFLTDDEALTMAGNAYCVVIPENLA